MCIPQERSLYSIYDPQLIKCSKDYLFRILAPHTQMVIKFLISVAVKIHSLKHAYTTHARRKDELSRTKQRTCHKSITLRECTTTTQWKTKLNSWTLKIYRAQQVLGWAADSASEAETHCNCLETHQTDGSGSWGVPQSYQCLLKSQLDISHPGSLIPG